MYAVTLGTLALPNDDFKICLFLVVFILHFIFLAPLPTFKEELVNKELQEDSTVLLKCEVSQPDVSATWKKGTQVISPSSKYEIKQEGTTHTLKIYNLKPEDSGKYTCDIGNQKTTANVSVEGRGIVLGLCSIYLQLLIC